LTAGTRRNGSSKLGPFTRATAGHPAQPGRGIQDSRSPLESFTPQHGFAPRDRVTPRDGFTAYDPFNLQHQFAPQDGFAAQDDFDPQDGFAPRGGHGGSDGHASDGHASDGHGSDGHAHEYTGRHAGPRGKTARKRVGKAVPAAAAAATLAVGAAAYFLIGGTSQPQASQLNAAIGTSAGAAGGSTSAGQANGAAAATIKATTAVGPGTASSKAKHAKATPSAKPSASHAATSRAAAPAAAATKQAAAAPAASTAAAAPAHSATLSCNLSDGLLPENVTAIVSFLLAHGYSDNAAAGIAGNMYQESKGNPESEGMGGGGLIGWTPLPAGFVTGNVTADLNTQLAALLTYNQGWAQYIPELDSAASPADAASIYVTDFERAGIPAASTREAAATDVASACGI
jgi:Phage tail lysozyme